MSAPPRHRGLQCLLTNFPRRASSITAENEAAMAAAAAAASASVSNLPTVDDEDEEPYEAPPPRVVVDGPTDGSGSSGFFGGFVRRISNAFASLTSPLPELPSPVVEEGAEVPEPIETLAKINVDITGVPPPPPADATAPPPPPKADDIATAPAAEAK
ncbi:hypothetical protein BC829DRAFT_378399 [Chytridium lagenaria]|nr:hypothetical protein BC829DRAFT_378399 [Chytridium lagenaria]